jgi:polyphosphate kinase
MPRRPELKNKSRKFQFNGASARHQIAEPAASTNGREDGEIEELTLPELTPDLFINRELSWLDFNARVLAEAADQRVPLLERVKFISIFSSNMDEFYMIRVAGVKRKITAGITEPGPDGRTPVTLYLAIRERALELMATQSTLFVDDIIPQLAAHGVELCRLSDLNSDQAQQLESYFRRDVFPVLTPQAIDRARRFPHVSNESLSLIVLLRTPEGVKMARVKIPKVLPRLVRVPSPESDTPDARVRYIWLEDLVAGHLDLLFPGYDDLVAYPFHVTRDSDIEIDDDEDEAQDLVAIMREMLSERSFGSVVRLMVDTSMPRQIIDWLLEQLSATERELYVREGPLALEDVRELIRLERSDLKDPPLAPAPLVRLSTADSIGPEPGVWGTHDIFGFLRDRDVFVHLPYQSFSIVTDFLRAAATDPDVVAIKQTLYRIGKDSPLIPALIEARDDDTQVAVLVEVKARFDEENNITWAERLERHGVHVAYGVAGLKTHCKLTLVVRREPDGLRRYAHLATGNYNAATARIYEDIGIITSREDLTDDVAEVFNVLTGYSEQESYRKIWIAPRVLRQQFLDAIAQEIAIHRQQGNGRLIFKMNALVDRELIRALYAASQAGVSIDLIVRGICCLRPGVPGWSENIRVRSVVGRFLEHSRIYYFGNDGHGKVYLGSADMMERNLDRRVEVVLPVDDPAFLAHLRDTVLPMYLDDTENSWQLDASGSWRPVKEVTPHNHQNVQESLLRLYSRESVLGSLRQKTQHS